MIGIGLSFTDRKAIESDFEVKNLMSTDSIVDLRDNIHYEVLKIDSLIWFNENLSLVTENSEAIVTSSFRFEGRLYSFLESKSACPKGWRLPTVKEFDRLIDEVFNIDFTGLAELEYNWQTINNNPVGFNFNQTGLMHKRKVMSRESFNIWLDDSEVQGAYHAHMYETRPKNTTDYMSIFRHTHDQNKPKKNRKFAIRCVCEVGTQLKN